MDAAAFAPWKVPVGPGFVCDWMHAVHMSSGYDRGSGELCFQHSSTPSPPPPTIPPPHHHPTTPPPHHPTTTPPPKGELHSDLLAYDGLCDSLASQGVWSQGKTASANASAASPTSETSSLNPFVAIAASLMVVVVAAVVARYARDRGWRCGKSPGCGACCGARCSTVAPDTPRKESWAGGTVVVQVEGSAESD